MDKRCAAGLLAYRFALTRAGLVSALLLAALTACTTFAVKHAEVYQALARGDPGQALQRLEANKGPKRNRSLYDLDKAMLLSMLGDYQQSNERLESAKQAMQRLSATSISENVTAVLINEATRSYAGQPYEQLLVYAYKAMNYLALNDLDSARVEILQADVQLREWESAGELEGLHASAFVRYLGGVIFEANREWSDALISYRKAYEVLNEIGSPVPRYLQGDLLRLTQQQGLQDEHGKLRDEFGLEEWLTFEESRKQAQVVLIYHQGLVSRMHEHSVFHFSPELNYSVRISVPYYPDFQPYITHSLLQVGAQQAETEIIADVDRFARANLDSRMPGLILRTMARVVAKKTAAHQAGKDNSLAGFMTDVAGLVTEVADTRSWTSLPATIQIARLAVTPGEHRLTLPRRDTIAIDGAADEGGAIKLKAGRIKVISIHSTVN